MVLDGITSRLAALPPWAQRALMVLAVLLLGYIVLALVRSQVLARVARAGRGDPTVISFVSKIITSAGWLIVLAAALGAAGVNAAALLGGLAIGGFIVGFALKDTLGNLAAGVVLLLNRPFNVGDTVTVDGHTGRVDALGMALTHIEAADARLITIPNGKVLGNSIVNHTRRPIRRADVVVGIGYEDDISTAVKAILDALRADARVLAEPEAGVRITALADSSVTLQVRPWVKTEDYWQAQADFHATIKAALASAGCSIPYPQRDVHLHQAPAGDAGRGAPA